MQHLGKTTPETRWPNPSQKNNMRLGPAEKDTPLLFFFPCPSIFSFDVFQYECLSLPLITYLLLALPVPVTLFLFVDHVIGLHLRPLYSQVDRPAAGDRKRDLFSLELAFSSAFRPVIFLSAAPTAARGHCTFPQILDAFRVLHLAA